MNRQTFENCLFFTGTRCREKEEGALRSWERAIGMTWGSEGCGHAASTEIVATWFCSIFETARRPP